MEFLNNIAPNVVELINNGRLLEATLETIYMTLVSGIFVLILGVILGIILVVTRPRGIAPSKGLYNFLDSVISLLRSIPFVIMLALIAPLTRLITGSTIGTTAAIVPLVFGMVPFFSKQVENALLEVDSGIVEAAQSMGASNMEIIFGVYLREGMPALIRTTAVSIINLISLTAMAGTIGGGGIGNLAITRGYNLFQTDVTLACTLIIILLVVITQILAQAILKAVEH